MRLGQESGVYHGTHLPKPSPLAPVFLPQHPMMAHSYLGTPKDYDYNHYSLWTPRRNLSAEVDSPSSKQGLNFINNKSLVAIC